MCSYHFAAMVIAGDPAAAAAMADIASSRRARTRRLSKILYIKEDELTKKHLSVKSARRLSKLLGASELDALARMHQAQEADNGIGG